ncbi:hypothetical protein Z517_07322 [Fonsecaea pedrosoi CBS 271.37]|uniref:Xylanolytic transcriptional activator regulatory domain-containing protein n=1 Tax=Fonsecaea pedrosoi CBS 271.37 TaxID=1442368 RepID=A0A0D2DS64_9EURO|nr:uncharacterized protein Z517_07322 [Fonsecaea pedrosoi CBS 271.37]KIW80706.1 hypothetical protein Z517_07322 [Fonsecaea pedrosoi CBS 271.37]
MLVHGPPFREPAKVALHSPLQNAHREQECQPPRSAQVQEQGYEVSGSHDGFFSSVVKVVSHDGDHSFPTGHTAFYTSKILMPGDNASVVGNTLLSLPTEAEADFHLSTFFLYLESNWFYFEETWLREVFSLVFQAKRGQCQVDDTLLCLSLMVMALGASFKHLRSLDSKMDQNRQTQQHDHPSDTLPGAEYFNQAQRLIPQALRRPSLLSVQVCLLTSIYGMPSDNREMGYTYSGMALRMCVALSFHRKDGSPNISEKAREVQKRVFWTVYCIERRISMALGYPEMLQTTEISISLPTRLDDIDQSCPTRVDRLTAFTELTLLHSLVIRKRLDGSDLIALNEIRTLLEQWKDRLPPSILDHSKAQVRATLHLDMMYQMVWVDLGRRTLLDLVKNHLKGQHGGVPHGRETGEQTPVQRELSTRCVGAALKVLEAIATLHRRSLLARFSYTDLHSCISATVILLLGSIQHEESEQLPSFQHAIDQGMEALDFLAGGDKNAGHGYKLVRLLQNTVARLRRRAHVRRGGPGISSSTLASPLPPRPGDESDDHQNKVDSGPRPSPAEGSVHDPVELPWSGGLEPRPAADRAHHFPHLGQTARPDNYGGHREDHRGLDFATWESLSAYYSAQDLQLFGFDGFQIFGEGDLVDEFGTSPPDDRGQAGFST